MAKVVDVSRSRVHSARKAIGGIRLSTLLRSILTRQAAGPSMSSKRNVASVLVW